MIDLKIIDKRKFNKQEITIYEYFINNYDDIQNLKAQEVAKSCYCSTTSVNRFCKKIGIASFREFKLLVKLDNETKNKTKKEVQLLNSYEEYYINKEFVNYFKSLKEKPIYIFGKGSSDISAQYLFRQLLILKYKPIWVNDYGLLFHLKDVHILIISSSGMNKFVMEYVTNHRAGNTIISITAKDSLLANKSDHIIEHDFDVNLMNKIQKEQQLHIIILINSLIDNLNK